jgi:hypothetical protein
MKETTTHADLYEEAEQMRQWRLAYQYRTEAILLGTPRKRVRNTS